MIFKFLFVNKFTYYFNTRLLEKAERCYVIFNKPTILFEILIMRPMIFLTSLQRIRGENITSWSIAWSIIPIIEIVSFLTFGFWKVLLK